MKKIIPLFFPLFISISLFSQNKLAYRLFDIKGKKILNDLNFEEKFMIKYFKKVK